MKKNIKILSIFLFIFGFVFLLQLNSETKVKGIDMIGYSCSSASNYCKDNNNVTASGNLQLNYTHTTLTVSAGGQISLEYEYGYSEILIVVEKCVKVSTNNKAVCNSAADFKPDLVVHYSGSKAENYQRQKKKDPSAATKPKKEINLATFGYSNGDILRISMIYDIDSNGGTVLSSDIGRTNSDFYYPQFCNVNVNQGVTVNECKPDRKSTAQRAGVLLPSSRVEGYEEKKNGAVTYSMSGFIGDLGVDKSKITVKYGDSMNMIYMGSTPLEEHEYNKNFKLYNIVLVVDSSGGNETVTAVVNDIIIPVLLAVVAVVAVVTCSVLGYQIVKSADEPEERSEKVKRLRNIIIGLIAIAIVLIAVKPVTTFVQGLMDKSQQDSSSEEN